MKDHMAGYVNARIELTTGQVYMVAQGNTDKLHLVWLPNLNAGRYPGKAVCGSQTAVGCGPATLPDLPHDQLAQYISDRLCSRCYGRWERKVVAGATSKLVVIR